MLFNIRKNQIYIKYYVCYVEKGVNGKAFPFSFFVLGCVCAWIVLICLRVKGVKMITFLFQYTICNIHIQIKVTPTLIEDPQKLHFGSILSVILSFHCARSNKQGV